MAISRPFTEQRRNAQNSTETLAMQAMKNESGENPDPFFQLTYGPVFQEVYPIPRDPLQPKIGGVSLAPPY